LLPETGPPRALEVAERLRASIAASPLAVGASDPVAITVSIGVAALDARHSDLQALLQCADSALYAAKSAGRNRVHLAESTPPAALHC